MTIGDEQTHSSGVDPVIDEFAPEFMFPIARVLIRVLTALIFIWIALVVYSSVQAAGSANDAKNSLDKMRGQLDDLVVLMRDGEIGQLDAVEAAFNETNGHLSRAWMKPVRYLPVIGRQFESSQKLTRSGGELATALRISVSDLAVLSDQPLTTGSERLEVIDRGIEILDRLNLELADVELGPEGGLWGPLKDARNEMAIEISDTSERILNAREALWAVGEVLSGPSHYLLVAANNAEMRAGSGMFLSLGVLDTVEGNITLGPMNPSWLTNPEIGSLPILDSDYETNWDFVSPSAEFRNLAMTPRFEVSAEQAASMWEATHPGEELDGVLLVDPVAVSILARSTGPVLIADELRDSEELLHYLLNGQYEGVEDQFERRDELSLVAGQTLLRLLVGEVDLIGLARDADEITSGRHLMIWNRDPKVQDVWVEMGISGALHEGSLAVSILNRGGNKLDYFLKPNARIELTPTDSGTQVTVLVSLRNEVDKRGQPAYVLGPYPGVDAIEGEYVGELVINLPGASHDIEVVQGDNSRIGDDGPTRLIVAGVRLVPGQEEVYEIRFQLPEEIRSIEIPASGRFLGTGWVYGDERWRDVAPRTLTW